VPPGQLFNCMQCHNAGGTGSSTGDDRQVRRAGHLNWFAPGQFNTAGPAPGCPDTEGWLMAAGRPEHLSKRVDAPRSPGSRSPGGPPRRLERRRGVISPPWRSSPPSYAAGSPPDTTWAIHGRTSPIRQSSHGSRNVQVDVLPRWIRRTPREAGQPQPGRCRPGRFTCGGGAAWSGAGRVLGVPGDHLTPMHAQNPAQKGPSSPARHLASTGAPEVPLRRAGDRAVEGRPSAAPRQPAWQLERRTLTPWLRADSRPVDGSAPRPGAFPSLTA
jgi:hypothetical protein